MMELEKLGSSVIFSAQFPKALNVDPPFYFVYSITGKNQKLSGVAINMSP